MTNARSYQYKPCGLVYHGTKFKAREMTSEAQIVLRSKAAADNIRTDLKIPLAMEDFSSANHRRVKYAILRDPWLPQRYGYCRSKIPACVFAKKVKH